MDKNRKQYGFSLMEVLIATGIMAIGMVMVATIFPVGVKLTALTTERTIGAVVADEAFAKIQLYGLRDFQYWSTFPAVDSSCSDFQYTNSYDVGPDGIPLSGDEPISPAPATFNETDEFLYPSADVPAGQERNYHWSALCRRVGAKDVRVTVFVTRKIGPAAYHAWDPLATPPDDATSNNPWPKPVPVNVDYFTAQPKELVIKDNPAFSATVSRYFFDDGFTIVDNLTGKIYRILEVKDARDASGNLGSDGVPDTLVLTDEWQWSGYPFALPTNEVDRTIWVVPPAVGSDRYPCVGVYQKVIRFDEIN